MWAHSASSRWNPASISGLRTAGDGFAIETEQGKLRGRVGFVAYGGHVFQLLGYSAEYRWSGYEAAVRRALASFDELTDSRALDVQPARVKIVQAAGSTTLEALAKQHGATIPVETLRLINRLDPGERLASGRSYKVVTGGK